MKTSTMKRAASYGVGHLMAIAEDMSDKSYSQQMRNDMNLAIAMLRAAPVLIANAGMLAGFAEAGPCDDETMKSLHSHAQKVREAIRLGTDRSYGEIL